MAHIHEKIDFTVGVWIVQDGKVLLHIHKVHNKWLQPGGHIELDEDPTQAAIREAKEETGLDVELIGGRTADPSIPGDLLVPRFINRHHVNDTHEHVDMTYLARVAGGELKAEDGTETPLRWFSRDEIEHNEIGLNPSTRAYALAAIDALS